MHKIPKPFRIFLGGFLVFLGAVFILVPGPAILFLPLGLAILSLDYPWAKRWLKKCQRMMSAGAEKMDSILYKMKR